MKVSQEPCRNGDIHIFSFLGTESPATVTRLNTLFSGSCYYVSTPQNLSTQRQIQSDTKLLVNMKGNSSWATLYLLPQNSTNAVILDEWHRQVMKFEVPNFQFLEKVLTKEFHEKRPSEDSPCVQRSESMFYKVGLFLIRSDKLLYTHT